MAAIFPWTELNFSMIVSRFQILSWSAQRYVIAVLNRCGSGEDSGAIQDGKATTNPIL